MKNLLFLLLLGIVSCRTPLGTRTAIYGVVEGNADEGWYSINDGKEYISLDDAKADKYLGRYVKADGYLSHRHIHGVDGWVMDKTNMWVVNFTVVKDCDAIVQILNAPEFDKHFQISKREGDSLTVYFHNYGDMDATTLCNNINVYGKTISFAKAEFEVKLNDHPKKGEVINPRIVVWKEGKKYRFFNTGTNATFDASVKNGKVKVWGAGAF